MRRTGSGVVRACALAAMLASSGAALGATTLAANLADLSLEELGNVVVSSVSLRDEPLAHAAASIYVISADDIRRSGALNLPQALQLAPNLQVARADANQYAITARGMNGVLANKMLVLIDGRTVYSPLFSGTFWEAQDVMLEDVERIEVISGPGAALWGSNAVNGVINVITRAASETQGGLATLQTGTTQRDAAARYGGTVGDGHYRVYGKEVRRDNSSFGNGTPIRDAAQHVQMGFRADWGRAADGFTLQGDAYGEQIDQAPRPRDLAGMNLLARWSRSLADGSSLRLQGYVDRTSRLQPGSIVEHLDTYDFELTQAFRRRGRHTLLWGFGLRESRDRVENSAAVGFLPPDNTMNRNHLFVQDEIALRPDLDLTLGAKVETNEFTGAEALPSVRLAWRPDAQSLVWTALSRAVRAPSRVDREFFSPPNAAPPYLVAGGPLFQSETSNVLELGYRAQATRRLSYSVTGYYHDNEKLRTLVAAPGGAVFTNQMNGETYGVESWATWRPADWWRLSGGIVRQHVALHLPPGVVDLSGATAPTDPDGWWKLRASFDLGAASELDLMLRHYDALAGPPVPSYNALDARWGWHVTKKAELSFLVQNLLDRRHPEWGPPANRAELERAVFAKLRIDL
jgi:iron complex outermembrane receptor protein